MNSKSIRTKTLCSSIIIFFSFALHGQGVAINSDKALPDPSAMLDISSANKGLLIPRVALIDAGDKITINAPAHSLLIYNTTIDPVVFAKGPGVYYNQGNPDKANWLKIMDEIDEAAPKNMWSIDGNDDIDATKFIGTTNNKNIIFKQSNEEVAQVYTGGATVFTGNTTTGVVPATVKGAGTRMMWIPALAAFRVGRVNDVQWDAANIGLYSFATGANTVASGLYTTAMGNNTTASGYSSTAFGYYTTASNYHATAMGSSTTASGFASVATGYLSVASGRYATAMGREAKAQGDTSFAMGYKTLALGNTSFAMGYNTIASGKTAVAMGYNTTASGDYSVAMGWGGLGATGNYSTAIGYQADAAGEYSLSMGLTTWASKTAATAMGRQTQAHGDNSTAMGYMTTASGVSAVSMGSNTLASANASTAMGSNTKATGLFSTAMGYKTTASKEATTAMGFNTVASGKYATSMGFNTTASGDYASAIGYLATASGSNATAIGYATDASGSTSTAFGNATKAAGISSTSMGNGTAARARSSLSIGSFNDNQDILNDLTSNARIFQIGNGADDNNRSNALTILRSGNVGLGTVKPTALLHLKSANGTNSWNSYIKLEAEFGGGYGAIRYNELKGLQFGLFNANDNFSFVNQSGVEVATIQSNGAMDIKGDLTANGIVNPSDIRLKENITSLKNVLEKISNIQPISYYFKDKTTFSPAHQIGFSAQEIEKAFPELVKKNVKGFLAVNYAQMSAVAIEAIKEQQHIITTQDDKITALQKQMEEQKLINKNLSTKNNDLENRVLQLEKLVSSNQ